VRMPVSRRTKRGLALIVGLLLSSLLFAACGIGDNSPSILNTAGPVAASETFLFWVILVIAVIIFVLVEGVLVYSIFRFRERPGMPNPRQNHGNLTLEFLWTAIPTVVLFIILFFTIRGLLQVAPEAEPQSGPKIQVTAIGHQWWWEFYYPQYNITTADALHVPVNATVHVDLFSNNVIHSFWVPALTGKTDVIPGHDNSKWFIAQKRVPIWAFVLSTVELNTRICALKFRHNPRIVSSPGSLHSSKQLYSQPVRWRRLESKYSRISVRSVMELLGSI
jgi:cytochrome c oxidase subunit 2